MAQAPTTRSTIPRKHSGAGATNSYGAGLQMDETPKYIKNLRCELNVALKQNLQLRVRLDKMEEDNESGL